ncbi:type II toxin-antitoxin system Phd/YefM family antitoxin [Paramicrobacterium fandaimingii]|uniref:type II toxin-antitoxin system Phd/YefM family antitoxin n=1 Tax=Paramicrobacterium fandaimingii TaxID=2708079 RepID=UPI001422F0CB|nr:type II toxin-antitoxin system prevent-host-death family antitoxin [Microbacterium fandaimingii]
MDDVGIRALKQNASAVVASVAEGRSVTITDRGRPVAQLSPLVSGELNRLLVSGRLRAPRRSLRDLSVPAPGELTPALRGQRDDERY